MEVPSFWAEARVRRRDGRRQVTLRRFGWSDVDAASAQQHAQARADDALARLLAGEALPRREPKVPYNGADGLPIREQVVERIGAVVLTRNAYGAVCLNSPDALFADVDFVDRAPGWVEPAVMAAVLVAGLVAWAAAGVAVAIGVGLATLLVVGGAAKALLRRRAGDDPEAAAIARVEAFLAAHPDWRVRVYRTPAGLRLLAMQRRFDPAEAAVAGFFAAVGTDPVYVRMCLRQRCFRARVSAKPWRIGIERHLTPRPGTWPVRPERLPERERWLAAYDARAAGFSACRFVAELGGGAVDADIALQCALHESLCRAESALPLA